MYAYMLQHFEFGFPPDNGPPNGRPYERKGLHNVYTVASGSEI
jgi:hypothetical protein